MLTADREFVGEQWWTFLTQHQIRFFIRLRANMQVDIPRKGRVKAYWLFNHLALHTAAYFHPKIVQVKGVWVYLSGMKFVNDQGKREFLIVASFEQTDQALQYYKQRWQIETMFKAFKSAGVHLEDTHLTDYKRLDKLLMITAIAWVWAYKVGIYRDKKVKAIKVKKHGRPAKSLFKYGIEYLAQALLNALDHIVSALSKIFLSCT